MSKLSNIVNLKNIVFNVMNDLNISNGYEYKRMMQWAIRGLVNLNIYHLQTATAEYLTVDSNNMVLLPEDFIDYIRIGWLSNGKIITYSRNDAIYLPRATSCINPSIDSGLLYGEEDTNTVWVQVPMKVYNNAYYRIDKEYNRIIFKGDLIGEQIVLEYTSTGVSTGGETWIPRIAQEAMIAHVHYQKVLNDKESQSEINRRLLILGHELDKLERAEIDFTADELIDVISSSRSTLVK